jgi:AcrR family transcriptional regulator
VEAATKQRELSGDKAQRIIEAMRASVAARGIAGSTFEHVSREAGVSRGLLHYYFGTKEQLLVEVVRRDSEVRVARLDEPLAQAKNADDVVDVLVSNLLDLIENEPGFFDLIFEVYTAGSARPRSSARSRSCSGAAATTSRRSWMRRTRRASCRSASAPSRPSPTCSRSPTGSRSRPSPTAAASSTR